MEVDFEARLWRWDARADVNWIFVHLPQDVSDHIRDLTDGRPSRGFGAVRVSVLVGTSRWRTSIFPGGQDGKYSLPVKKSVRRAEGVDVGDRVTVRLEVLDV